MIDELAGRAVSVLNLVQEIFTALGEVVEVWE
jgi:hypothetical protein